METNKECVWEYQKNCIMQANEIIKNDKNAIISLPTGAGKSRIVLEVVKELLSVKPNAKIIIIANRRVLLDSVWRSEISRWAPNLKRKITSIDGRREPFTRDTFWNNAKNYNYVVIATPQIITQDINNRRLDIRDFDLIVLDEAHHSIKKEGDRYILAANYKFLNQFSKPILGITIRKNESIPIKVQETAKILNAFLITDESVKEKPLEKNVIYLTNRKREEAEKILNKEIARLIAIFKSKYPTFNGFPFTNVESTIKKCNIKDESNQLFVKNLAKKYYKYNQIKKYLNEDQVEYIKKEFLIDNSEINKSLSLILNDYEKIKLNAVFDNIRIMKESGPVLVFVKFRSTANELTDILKRNGISSGLIIGGLYDFPAEKLKEYIKNRIEVLVATYDMCGEGLNLQYFKTIFLVSGIRNDFKRLNIEGRIRGGKLIQFIYKNSDEIDGVVNTNIFKKNNFFSYIKSLFLSLLILIKSFYTKILRIL